MVIKQALRVSGMPADPADVLSHLTTELHASQLGVDSLALIEMRLI